MIKNAILAQLFRMWNRKGGISDGTCDLSAIPKMHAWRRGIDKMPKGPYSTNVVWSNKSDKNHTVRIPNQICEI